MNSITEIAYGAIVLRPELRLINDLSFNNLAAKDRFNAESHTKTVQVTCLQPGLLRGKTTPRNRNALSHFRANPLFSYSLPRFFLHIHMIATAVSTTAPAARLDLSSFFLTGLSALERRLSMASDNNAFQSGMVS